MPGGLRQVLIHSEISFVRLSVGCEANHFIQEGPQSAPSARPKAGLSPEVVPSACGEEDNEGNRWCGRKSFAQPAVLANAVPADD